MVKPGSQHLQVSPSIKLCITRSWVGTNTRYVAHLAKFFTFKSFKEFCTREYITKSTTIDTILTLSPIQTNKKQSQAEVRQAKFDEQETRREEREAKAEERRVLAEERAAAKAEESKQKAIAKGVRDAEKKEADAEKKTLATKKKAMVAEKEAVEKRVHEKGRLEAERRKKIVAELERKINPEVTDEVLICLLEKIEERCGFNGVGQGSYMGDLELIIKNSQIEDGADKQFSVVAKETEEEEATILFVQLSNRGRLEEGGYLTERVDRVRKYIHAAHLEICVCDKVREIKGAGYEATKDTSIVLGASLEVLENQKPFQNLLTYLLITTKVEGVRLYEGNVYCKIKSGEANTHAWKPFAGEGKGEETPSSVLQWVHTHTNQLTHNAQWQMASDSPGNPKAAAEWLADCNDVRFPKLAKDRHVFSFKNGVYVTRNYDEESDTCVDKFYPYASEEKLPANVVACKFFDAAFNNYDDVAHWSDIPTPHFQQILDYQRFGKDVQKWTYIMIGRMLFDIGDLDNWQVIPFFQGAAGSGKSTILLSIIKRFYDKDDVGICSNNVERKFGISAFASKFIFLAPEIKNDWSIDQAEFQSMVSGEDLSPAVKQKGAKAIVWTTPGALAGNQIPGFSDNSGSVARRVLLLEFVRKVVGGDTTLGKKLLGEIIAILKKSCAAYLEARNEYGTKDIWTVGILPEYFHKTRKSMGDDTHALQAYLNSGAFEFGVDKYCDFSDFLPRFNAYCDLTGKGKQKWVQDYYKGVFADFGLDTTIMSRRNYPRDKEDIIRSKWITGLDFSGDDDMEEEAEPDCDL